MDGSTAIASMRSYINPQTSPWVEGRSSKWTAHLIAPSVTFVLAAADSASPPSSSPLGSVMDPPPASHTPYTMAPSYGDAPAWTQPPVLPSGADPHFDPTSFLPAHHTSTPASTFHVPAPMSAVTAGHGSQDPYAAPASPASAAPEPGTSASAQVGASSSVPEENLPRIAKRRTKGKVVYKCSRCGLPKKGHLCRARLGEAARLPGYPPHPSLAGGIPGYAMMPPHAMYPAGLPVHHGATVPPAMNPAMYGMPPQGLPTTQPLYMMHAQGVPGPQGMVLPATAPPSPYPSY